MPFMFLWIGGHSSCRRSQLTSPQKPKGMEGQKTSFLWQCLCGTFYWQSLASPQWPREELSFIPAKQAFKGGFRTVSQYIVHIFEEGKKSTSVIFWP
jgi:hypothetical protein